MTVRAFVLEGERIEVTGTGYATAGEFRGTGGPSMPDADDHLALALRIGALCNDAAIELRDGRNAVLGDPTEGALLVAAAKAGLDRPALDRDYPRIGEVPFDSESKRMITVHRTPEGRTVAYLKGGSPRVLDACRARLARGGRPAPRRRGPRAGSSRPTRSWPAAPCGSWPWPAATCPTGYGEEDLARDLRLRRAGRHDRPAPRGGQGGDRHLPGGGHPRRR